MKYRQRTPLIPAVYVILREGDEVLLMERKNTGWRDGEFCLVAGHVESGEHPTAAAIREVQEEVGISAKIEDLRFVHVMHRLAEEGDHERLDLFFELKTWEGSVILNEPDKCAQIRWCSLSDIPPNTVPPVIAALQWYQSAVYFSESASS